MTSRSFLLHPINKIEKIEDITLRNPTVKNLMAPYFKQQCTQYGKITATVETRITLNKTFLANLNTDSPTILLKKNNLRIRQRTATTIAIT